MCPGLDLMADCTYGQYTDLSNPDRLLGSRSMEYFMPVLQLLGCLQLTGRRHCPVVGTFPSDNCIMSGMISMNNVSEIFRKIK